MIEKTNDPLLLAGQVLTIIMQFACAAAAGIMVVLSVLAVVYRDRITTTSFESSLGNTEPLVGLPVLFLLVAAFLGLGFVFFRKLKAIINTVGEGNPFEPENAQRLNMMAWLLLAMQILIMPATAIGAFLQPWINAQDEMDLTIEMGPDVEGILMVVILFILARVFKHGAAMRDDLEGTI